MKHMINTYSMRSTSEISRTPHSSPLYYITYITYTGVHYGHGT